MTQTIPNARVVIVTGVSGAGRTTAINALEDIGFEAIDNMPLSLLERVLEGPEILPPMAIGIDVRNRDFATETVVALLEHLRNHPSVSVDMLFLDCRPDILIRRYSETRRRHPLAPNETPAAGIAREADMLDDVKHAADRLIDTSDITPHQLRAEIGRVYGGDGVDDMAISVESFSYKRGLPRGVDLVFDVRFLKNPHWNTALKQKDGRDSAVVDYIASDPLFSDFFTKIVDLILTLLPAFKREGKTYLSIAIGCTGGQHRSVTVAEKLSMALAKKDWRVSTRHRELERRAPPGGTV